MYCTLDETRRWSAVRSTHFRTYRDTRDRFWTYWSVGWIRHCGKCYRRSKPLQIPSTPLTTFLAIFWIFSASRYLWTYIGWPTPSVDKGHIQGPPRHLGGKVSYTCAWRDSCKENPSRHWSSVCLKLYRWLLLIVIIGLLWFHHFRAFDIFIRDEALSNGQATIQKPWWKYVF